MSKTMELPLLHKDMVERVAVAIERTMFAPHELPLGAELHGMYRDTARAAIRAVFADLQLSDNYKPPGKYEDQDSEP